MTKGQLLLEDVCNVIIHMETFFSTSQISFFIGIPQCTVQHVLTTYHKTGMVPPALHWHRKEEQDETCGWKRHATDDDVCVWHPFLDFTLW
jgi:hypothetical protein